MGDFDDLIAANRQFAQTFDDGGFDGVAQAGVAIVTCIDSRIVPLAMVGLSLGDAKIMRNPGGRVTPQTMDALVLGVHLLGVHRILVIPHTRCAMVIHTEEELRQKVAEATGRDVSGQSFQTVSDQQVSLIADVDMVRQHSLIPSSVKVGGFLYDVDTGLLDHIV